MKRFALISVAVLALAGCSVSPLQFVPPNVEMSQAKIDAALVSTIVTVAPRSEAKGNVEIAGAESTVSELWKSALDDTILRMAFFRDDSPRRLTLAVKILKFSMSDLLGYDVIAIARYQLIDRNSGAIVYSTDIETTGHAKDFAGVNRVRNAASRSVQLNISSFLQQLETADLPKSLTHNSSIPSTP